MRVLFSTVSPASYMLPPILGDEQVNCGPDWTDAQDANGRVRSLATPVGEYDLAAVAAKLPAEQQPDVVVCLVDASWRNLPRRLEAFRCPRVLLVADTHHCDGPLMGMIRYLAAEPYDRVVFVYDRHHIGIFRSAGFQNLHWFPGLTLPHEDATVRAARKTGARANRVAFVGQAGKHHPRRTRLIEAMHGRKVPFVAQPLPQAAALGFYGASLVGFNASLNGDLNLRVFEILASGAALLTDRLAPESGLGNLFAEGRELIAYGSPEELAERAAHLVAHPAEAKAVGAAGARWFDGHFGAARRRAAFRALAFDGTAPEEFAFSADDAARVFFGGDTDRLLQGVMVYEGVQELHRTQETVRVGLEPEVPVDVKALCGTLPRVEFGPNGDGRRADLAVFGREQAIAGVTVDASLLWCWDAQPDDLASLQGAFGPAGYKLASQDVAVLAYDETAKAAADGAPARRHVLLYTDDPESGGVAQYNHTILCALARAGCRVTCVQSRADNPLLAEQRTLGVAHRWLDYHTGKDFARTTHDAGDALQIFQHDRPDLVVFSDCCPVSNLAARQAAVQLGIPFIAVVGFVGEYLADNFAAHLPQLAAQYAAAREVVAVSQENLGLLRRRFGLAAARGTVIHYGRPEKFFAPRHEATRARLRAEIGVPDDAVLCFTAARLTAVKGFQHQLAALLALRNSPVAAKLHFAWAGDGDGRPSLTAEIKRHGLGRRVHLLGQRWDVADWLEAADIFVLPSHLEGMPLAIMEAMAKGVPVIATAVSGIPEELGETGVLLPNPAVNPSGVVLGLAETLKTWAEMPAERARVGAAGRARAEAMFREELMVRRTLALVGRQLPPATGGENLSTNEPNLEPALTVP